MKTTKRKTKVVGKRNYIDQETGELVNMNVVEVEERDFNFEKLWLGHIMQTLDIIGNKKMKIVMHILKNRNGENLFIATHRELVEKLGIGGNTINDTLKALQEGDFMTMTHQGVYRINPEVVFKGGYGNRMNILIKYRDEKAKNGEHPESKEEELAKKIEETRRQLEKLETQQLEQNNQKLYLKLAK